MSETDRQFVERLLQQMRPPRNAPVSLADYMRAAALLRRGAETQWRPIEEAPKEAGMFYLGWNGHWRGVIQYSVPAYEGDPEWLDEITQSIDPPPTHFIPLSALGEPTEKKK